jgi:hypothetical protein
MFRLSPQPEFVAWFESLGESEAEEVAAALEVVASAGEALDPPRVSRALLWFDGTGTGAGSLLEGGLELAVSHSAEALRSMLTWQRELIAALEAEPFGVRLASLSPEVSAEALDTVARLRSELRAWQREVLLRFASGTVSTERLTSKRAELMQTFSSVLELMGFSAGRFIALSNGLRELTIATTNPKLRVLFGVDATAKRLIVLLGEPLTRAYYGDSVRRAEQRWATYQERVLTERTERDKP